MSRIIISNGRVSEWVTLLKEVKEKLSMKSGGYLKYLLIKSGCVNKEVCCRGDNKIRQVEEKRLKSPLS
jgi:hypothetical protein